MKIIRFYNNSMLAFILMASAVACSVQENATSMTRASAYPRVIEEARDDKRFIVMFSGLDTFAVTSALVEKEKKEFTVHLNKLDSVHRSGIRDPKSITEKQMHIFMRTRESYTLDEPHTIPLNNIARITKVN